MNAQVDEVNLVADVEAGNKPDEVKDDVKVEIKESYTPEQLEEAEAMGYIPPERAGKLPEGKKFLGPVEFMERNPLYKQMKDLQVSFGQLNSHYQKVSEIEHKKAEKEFETKLADLKTQKVDALDNADHARVVEIDEEIRTAEKPVEVKPDNSDFDKWVGENKWYKDDQFLRVEATKVGEILYSDKLFGTALLDAVKDHLKQAHPEKFKNPAREKASSVEGGSQRSVQPVKSSSTKDLTADERTIFTNFKSSGLFKVLKRSTLVK